MIEAKPDFDSSELELHAYERLAGLPYAVTWAYTPPDAPFAELLPGARCRPQRGRDLGERTRVVLVHGALGASPDPDGYRMGWESGLDKLAATIERS